MICDHLGGTVLTRSGFVSTHRLIHSAGVHFRLRAGRRNIISISFGVHISSRVGPFGGGPRVSVRPAYCGRLCTRCLNIIVGTGRNAIRS